MHERERPIRTWAFRSLVALQPITAGTVINTLIKVGGTLKQPTIELDPAGAIVGGTAAVATAGLSIVAKSFADRFLSSKDPCGDARKEIAKKDAL